MRLAPESSSTEPSPLKVTIRSVPERLTAENPMDKIIHDKISGMGSTTGKSEANSRLLPKNIKRAESRDRKAYLRTTTETLEQCRNRFRLREIWYLKSLFWYFQTGNAQSYKCLPSLAQIWLYRMARIALGQNSFAGSKIISFTNLNPPDTAAVKVIWIQDSNLLACELTLVGILLIRPERDTSYNWGFPLLSEVTISRLPSTDHVGPDSLLSCYESTAWVALGLTQSNRGISRSG